jgi:hypothetical protein
VLSGEAAQQRGRQDRGIAQRLVEPPEHPGQEVARVLKLQHLNAMADPEMGGKSARMRRFIEARLGEAHGEGRNLLGRERAGGGG